MRAAIAGITLVLLLMIAGVIYYTRHPAAAEKIPTPRPIGSIVMLRYDYVPGMIIGEHYLYPSEENDGAGGHWKYRVRYMVSGKDGAKYPTFTCDEFLDFELTDQAAIAASAQEAAKNAPATPPVPKPDEAAPPKS